MSAAAFPGPEACRHRIAFTAFGVTLGLRSNDEALLARARESLPPGVVPAGGEVERWFTLLRSNTVGSEAARHRLLNKTDVVLESLRVSPILEALEDELRLAVASRTRSHVFVHAGVVAAEGAVLVLPGRSATGKTTLVRALLEAGAEYWSDEYAVFDEAGLVSPYPRRLSIRQGPNRRLREAQNGPLELRAARPMRLLVLTSFEAGATWQPRELSHGDAALGLLNHTLVARIRPEFALQVLANAVPYARALAGVRGEATTCAVEILRALRESR